MALPILPLLLLGGAAALILSSSGKSKSRSSVISSSTDDSVFVCGKVNITSPVTLEKIKSQENVISQTADRLSASLVSSGKISHLQRFTVITVRSIDSNTICQTLSQFPSPGIATVVTIYDITEQADGKPLDAVCEAIGAFSKMVTGGSAVFSAGECSYLADGRFAGLGLRSIGPIAGFPNGAETSKFAVHSNGRIDFFPIRGLEGDNDVTGPGLQ